MEERRPGARLAGEIRGRMRRSLRRYVVGNAIRAGGAIARVSPGGRPARHGITVIRDRPYRGTGERSHRLDVFVPAGPGPHPVVFYAHGGGFSMLSKETHWGMAMAYAKRGYLVVNVNYRLAPTHRYPAAVEDVCAAYEWMCEHVSEWGGDTGRLVLAGESAGANLVTILAALTASPWPTPWARRVFELGVVPTAVISACGMYQVSDVERLWRRRPLPPWIRLMLRDVSTGYLGEPSEPPHELADPILLLESNHRFERQLPRFFAFVGTRDPLLDDTRRLGQALAARGVPVQCEYYPGEIHAFHALVWREHAKRAWHDTFNFLSPIVAARPCEN